MLMWKKLRISLSGVIIVQLNLLMLVQGQFNKMEYHIRILNFKFSIRGLVADDAWL